MLGIHRHTVKDFSNFIREEYLKKFLSVDEKLGGNNIRVQV